MANDDPLSNVDDRLGVSPNDKESQPEKPNLDDIWDLAESLGPDERLRLVTRLWKTLPRDHRAALVTLQLEHVQNNRSHNLSDANSTVFESPPGPSVPDLVDRIFNPEHMSGLYSAPRRFDLASIFVVTAAYSLLLAALSLIGSPPVVMVVVAGMLGVIATTQAMFQQAANPRGVSIITGAVTFAIVCFILHFTMRGLLTPSLFVNTFIIGLPCGAILGYLMGTVVGGVFLVADMVRSRMEGRVELPIAQEAAQPGLKPEGGEETASAQKSAST